MMDVAIVFESMFGNTRIIAEAIGEGLRSGQDAAVTVTPVAEAEDLDLGHFDLLVVGGPTHYLRMSSSRSRQTARRMSDKPARKGSIQPDLDPAASEPGLREWLHSLPQAIPGRCAAAFDTRFGYPLAGGAAWHIAHRLRRHGYRMAVRPRGFVVSDMAGPLRRTEPDRAREWGAALLCQILDWNT
jgi:hypothetical protein